MTFTYRGNPHSISISTRPPWHVICKTEGCTETFPDREDYDDAISDAADHQIATGEGRQA